MISCAPGTGTSRTGAQSVLMPSAAQIVGEQARDGASLRRRRARGIARVEPAEDSGRRQRAPQRRPQPLHATALLIDEYEHVVVADRLAHGVDEPADLVVACEVAREQNEAGRARVLQEGGLVRRQNGAGHARDQSGTHGCLIADMPAGAIETGAGQAGALLLVGSETKGAWAQYAVTQQSLYPAVLRSAQSELACARDPGGPTSKRW